MSESKHKNYFTHETEESIVKFQDSGDIEERKKIFVSEIKPAFDKLVENIINVYRFHSIGNIDVLKSDCVSMLFENLSKFNATKGHKAFSYFNVIAKNWFIQRGKVFKKKTKSDVYFDKDLITFLEKNTDKIIVRPHEETMLSHEFFELLKDDIQSWDRRFCKPQELCVLEAVIHLLENPDSPSIYNKKGIYLYIREMTNLNTKQIVTNLSKFRKRYKLFKKKYEAGQF